MDKKDQYIFVSLVAAGCVIYMIVLNIAMYLSRPESFLVFEGIR